MVSLNEMFLPNIFLVRFMWNGSPHINMLFLHNHINKDSHGVKHPTFKKCVALEDFSKGSHQVNHLAPERGGFGITSLVKFTTFTLSKSSCIEKVRLW